MSTNTSAKQVFDFLTTRNFGPETGTKGQDPSQATVISFKFRGSSGRDYGTVTINLGDENQLDVFCADNVGRSMETQDKNEWYRFLEDLKNLAVRNRMSFGIKDINHLKYNMQGMAHAIKESILESWTGNRSTSWQGDPTQARLMIRHKRPMGEGDVRHRHIQNLFVETALGERYRLTTNSLTHGRAMLEHVRRGGNPYDVRGCHINGMVSELAILSRFRRANQGQLLEGDTAQLMEQVNQYHENLKRDVKSLGTARGYQRYFESWQPWDITEQDVVIESLRNLFVKQSIDTRIESALPLLARIQQQGTDMKEANIFEAWATRLVEGTWSLPDTPGQQEQLVELLSEPLMVGADATNATEQLHDLIGDDELFDQLTDLASQDARADCRQLVIDRLQQLDSHPEVRAVLDQLNTNDTAEMNPAAGTPADLGSDESTADDHPDAEPPTERLAEGRLIDEDGETLQHILDRFPHEVKNFEQSGELADDLYDALYDYHSHSGNMPYGVQKARTGDPYSWVADNLEKYLSNGSGHLADTTNDYQIERESAGEYDEYEDPLADILRIAGVPGGERAAPVYAHSDIEPTVDEGEIGAMIGTALAPEAGPLAAMAGDQIGDEVGLEETGWGLEPVPAAMENRSALAGEYGHSGRMRAVSEDVGFLDRLKDLAGLSKN